MCDVCHYTPCLNGCPNQPEPEAVYTCSSCKEGIFDGEEYAEIDGSYYHLECLNDNYTIRELLNLLDIQVETAEENDYYD
jgi:hypothetical protein